MSDSIRGAAYTMTRYTAVSFYTLTDIRQFMKVYKAKKPLAITMGGITLKLRPGLWDYACAWEILVEESYKPYIGKLPEELDTVIDLGAYIGDFAVWAAKEFNAKKVLAVDADPENFSFIPENIKLNNVEKIVKPIHKAIYSESNKKVSIKAPSEDIHAVKAIDSDESKGDIPTITFKKLLQNNKISFIDFLKVDIEGAEEFVFTDENKSIFKDKVRFVALEAHPNQRLSPYFFIDYLKDLGYRVHHKPYARWTPSEGKTVTLELQGINEAFEEK